MNPANMAIKVTQHLADEPLKQPTYNILTKLLREPSPRPLIMYPHVWHKASHSTTSERGHLRSFCSFDDFWPIQCPRPQQHQPYRTFTRTLCVSCAPNNNALFTPVCGEVFAHGRVDPTSEVCPPPHCLASHLLGPVQHVQDRRFLLLGWGALLYRLPCPRARHIFHRCCNVLVPVTPSELLEISMRSFLQH